jgi:leader peptidase (prepilin peptidase)/N-methyltransferase
VVSFFLILFGLEFGSFANVCIYRWPRNMSVSHPVRSLCPWCRHQISVWENIPVLSYLFLRGACGHCHSRISVRYPLVELTMPVLWLLAWKFLDYSGLKIQLPFMIAVCSFLFVVLITTLTDLDWKLIPDQASYLLITIGVCSAYWNPFLNIGGGFSAFQNSFLGIVGGALPLWLIGIGGKKIIGKEAMGGGDIKLLAGMGSFMGWESALLILMVGSLLGCFVALLGLLTRILRRGQYIPFGPFLNAGALLVFIFRCNQSMFDNAVCSFFHFR